MATLTPRGNPIWRGAPDKAAELVRFADEHTRRYWAEKFVHALSDAYADGGRDLCANDSTALDAVAKMLEDDPDKMSGVEVHATLNAIERIVKQVRP